MAVITAAEAQVWLAPSKFSISAIDADVEETARSWIFGRLQDRYDTTGWTDASNTPNMVSKTVALYYAIMEYEKAIAEDFPEGDAFSKRLWTRLEGLIDGIVGGSIILTEVEQDPSLANLDSPVFFPTDDEDEWDPWSGLDDYRRHAKIGMEF